jgi:hypothetical protein
MLADLAVDIEVNMVRIRPEGEVARGIVAAEPGLLAVKRD